MSDVASAYVELAHSIEQYIPGYIDGYYGPEEWKVSTKRQLADLAREAEALAEAVASLDDPERRSFLAAQVRAMEASIALLRGEPVYYMEEVRRLYDIEVEKVPEAQFEEAIALLDALLPGEGDLFSREQAFRKQFRVAPDRLRPLFDRIVQELRRRTRERFELPAGESFELRLVRDEPWSAYNWYLGEFRSRIDVNTDLPILVTELPDRIAHEAYPGHHTEHAIKEQRLYRDAGRGEHSILLINAPECVVSEGIAMRARRMVLSDEELRDWLRGELRELAGLPDVDIETMLAIHKIKEQLRGVTGNAALLFHQEGAGEEEVLAYLQRYRLATPEEARKSLQFITHPNFRSYTFTYTEGARLLDRLLEQGRPEEWFSRLLREPVTPSTIRQWIHEGVT